MDDVLLGLFEPLLEPLADLADGLGEILLEMFYPSETRIGFSIYISLTERVLVPELILNRRLSL